MLYPRLISDEEVLHSHKKKVKHPGHTFTSFLLALALHAGIVVTYIGLNKLNEILQPQTLVEMSLTADAFIDKHGVRIFNNHLVIIPAPEQAEEISVPEETPQPLPAKPQPQPEKVRETLPSSEAINNPATDEAPIAEAATTDNVQVPETIIIVEQPIENPEAWDISAITLEDLFAGPIPTKGITEDILSGAMRRVTVTCYFTLRSGSTPSDIDIPARDTHPVLAEKLTAAILKFKAGNLLQDIRFTLTQTFVYLY